MKQRIIAFFIVFLTKSILLFLIVLSGKALPEIHVTLRFLVYFILTAIVDWHLFSFLSKSLKKSNRIKLLFFAYGTFFFAPMLTSMLFFILNTINNIQVENKGSFDWAGYLSFVAIGFFFSTATSFLKSFKNKKSSERCTSVESENSLNSND